MLKIDLRFYALDKYDWNNAIKTKQDRPTNLKVYAFYIKNQIVKFQLTMIDFKSNTLILRLALAIIFLSHSIFGMFDNGINDFGNLYLNQIGFAPIGVPLAWAIKLSHVVCAILFLMNRYIKLASLATIFILVAGIFMVHLKNGWFVVGGGTNGIEYNFLLICVLLSLVMNKE